MARFADQLGVAQARTIRTRPGLRRKASHGTSKTDIREDTDVTDRIDQYLGGARADVAFALAEGIPRIAGAICEGPPA